VYLGSPQSRVVPCLPAVGSPVVTVDAGTQEATEAAEALEDTESTEPSVLYTAYFSSVDELIEHIHAADTLNLGFRVESYAVADADAPGAHHGEYEFTLFNDVPVRVEERD
jgi:hypothetical protein